MGFDPSSDSHRRYNPLTGESVIVSPHRMKRPWQGQTEDPRIISLLEHDPKCYLCPGNARTSGANNEKYVSTLVFGNDFPALLGPPGPPVPEAPHPLLQLTPVQGHCDVIIFHPRHDLTLARLAPADIEKIIAEWTAIYRKRGAEEGIKYVQIFENKGAMMGCSNPHPHGQVWSLSSIPQIPAVEMASLRKYAGGTHAESDAPKGPNGRPCLLCEYAHFEAGVAGSAGRIVLRNEHWLALVPWWAVWPFEVLLLPFKRHIPSLVDLTDDENTSLAKVISGITIKYDNLFECSFAYSMGVHQRPVPKREIAPVEDENDDDVAHVHFHFDPPLLRSATVRKFLVGWSHIPSSYRSASLSAVLTLRFLDSNS